MIEKYAFLILANSWENYLRAILQIKDTKFGRKFEYPVMT